MDKLRNYGAPILAIVLVLAWYFVIRPALSDDAAADEPAATEDSGAAPSPPSEKAPPAPE